MSNSMQFEKLNLDAFAKAELQENKLRSLYGGAEQTSYNRVETGNLTIMIPYDTIDDSGCTKPYDDDSAVAKCDAGNDNGDSSTE